MNDVGVGVGMRTIMVKVGSTGIQLEIPNGTPVNDILFAAAMLTRAANKMLDYGEAEQAEALRKFDPIITDLKRGR
jgi:hypothetical protein